MRITFEVFGIKHSGVVIEDDGKFLSVRCDDGSVYQNGVFYIRTTEANLTGE